MLHKTNIIDTTFDSPQINFDNYFSLFNLPQSFTLDLIILEHNYYKLQQEIHPDCFNYANEAEKSTVIEWSAKINDAYHTLKISFERAIYLLCLRGIDVRLKQNKFIDRLFLIKQMEWHESIENAIILKDINTLKDILDKFQFETDIRFDKLSYLLDSNINEQAAKILCELIFIERIIKKINNQISVLEDLTII